MPKWKVRACVCQWEWAQISSNFELEPTTTMQICQIIYKFQWKSQRLCNSQRPSHQLDSATKKQECKVALHLRPWQKCIIFGDGRCQEERRIAGHNT